MKGLPIITAFITINSICFSAAAQVVAVSNMKQNVVYQGTNNTLKIVRENTPCNSLSVSTDNGSIKKIGPCEYEYKPTNLGMAQIVVKSNKGTYNYLLRVEGKGTPAAYVGGWNGGAISKNQFETQMGIYGKQQGGEVKDRYKVSSFSYMVVRDGKALETRNIHSNRFDKDVQASFSRLRKHDLVVFYNITAEDNKQGTMILQPIQFLIL